MPKAKPVSLHPLSFEEAVKALIRINPNNQPQPKKKRRLVPKRRK